MQVSVTVPAGAELQLAFGVPSDAWQPQAPTARFTVTAEAGRRHATLLEADVPRPATKRLNGWQQARIPLDDFAGALTALHFEAHLLGGNDADLAWAVPRIHVAGADDRPSIILISIDTLRADHLGCYGYRRPTSPNIDWMAHEGVRFAQAIAPASWTLPSHASMLTGLNPDRHGATASGWDTPIAADVITLAERLQQQGYATAAFVGGVYVSEALGFAQGFDRFREAPLGTRPRFTEVIDHALEWARDHWGAPYFLFLHTYDVHVPYNPSPPFDAMFSDPYAGRYRSAFTAQDFLALGPTKTLDEPELTHIEALYDGEIRQIDATLGRLLALLRERAPRQRPCVIVTSDHGEAFQEHGALMHYQGHLYEEVVHVPLVFWCADRVTGARVAPEVVSLVDVTPTILALAGSAVPPDLDGMSLLPALTGGTAPAGRSVLLSTDGRFPHLPGAAYALRTERYKLIRSSLPGRPAEELFDLRSDPGEHVNLSDAAPVDAAPLRDALAHAGALAAPAGRPAHVVTPDALTLERMRQLGYAHD